MGRALAIDSGDTAWMLVSTALVMLMLLPGLALFYGGLVRAKNLLSVMSQVLGVTAIAILSWVGWDYSLAFSGGHLLLGGLGKIRLSGGGRPPVLALPTPRQGHPRVGLRRVPDDLGRDHRRAGDRRVGGAGALRRDDAVRLAVADHRLRSARAHGVGVRGTAVQARRDRFRRRHGRAHQFGRRGAGWRG